MERIFAFLPSLLLVACIGALAGGYIWYQQKRLGKNLNSIHWLKENKTKCRFLIVLPVACVLYPAIEELIFRAPLIIAFSSVTTSAWYGIFTSSAVFGLCHWFRALLTYGEFFFEAPGSAQQSDDFKREVKRIGAELGWKRTARRIFGVIFTSAFGIVLGYIGIRSQSIWLCFGIHAVWNLYPRLWFTLLVVILVRNLLRNGF